jgi:hypothetical protein
LARASETIAAETGLDRRMLEEGDRFEGVYRRRLDLVSGRFALIDNGKQFMLVPWRPVVERELGREVTGIMIAGRGVTWTTGHDRGPSIG